MSSKREEKESQSNVGLYKVMRALIHLIGCLQFSYSVYYDWNYVVIPISVSPMGSGYGGKLKFLTFWNAVSLFYVLVHSYENYACRKKQHDYSGFGVIPTCRNFYYIIWCIIYYMPYTIKDSEKTVKNTEATERFMIT